MKKVFKTPRILLIRSPYCFPGDPCPGWTAIRSALASITGNLQFNDAAAAFFETVIINGQYDKAIAGNVDKAVRRMASTYGYVPLELLKDLAALDRALVQTSNAYSPCQFYRHGFAHPGLNSWDSVRRFAGDPAANPFYLFAHKIWQPFDEKDSVDLALLWVERPGQIGPAATLALAWSKRWPDLPLKMVGPALTAHREIRPSGQWPMELIFGKGQLQDLLASKSLKANDPDGASGLIAQSLKMERGQPLIPDDMPAVVQATLKQNTSLVEWRAGSNAFDEVSGQLYAASRQGIWNHLILDNDCLADIEAFAAANPNIVHSFCYEIGSPSVFSDPELQFLPAAPRYGQTQSMPGIPLWMALQGTVGIDKMLAHFGAKTLMRLRLLDDGQTLFEVGQNLSYHFRRPADLPEGYLDEIVRMVAAGGSVNTQYVRHNMEKAYLIAYVEEGGVIIGNSCLKHPREEYVDAVSQQAGIDLHHYLERGYASVRPEYRGLGVGAELMAQLTSRSGARSIFAVIAESNIATQKMALRNKNRRVATFYSQRAQKEMSVWIPEGMLPKGIALPEQPDLA